MKDCAGGHHPDDEPVTWRQFDREMAHRDRLVAQKEHDAKIARELRERQMLLSHRIIIALIMAIGVALQMLFRR